MALKKDYVYALVHADVPILYGIYPTEGLANQDRLKLFMKKVRFRKKGWVRDYRPPGQLKILKVRVYHDKKPHAN